MAEKKNKNVIGIIIGAVVALTVLVVFPFAIKVDNPIKLGNSTENSTSTTVKQETNSENDSGLVVEDDWGEEIELEIIGEGGGVLDGGEINFEDEPTTFPSIDYGNYGSGSSGGSSLSGGSSNQTTPIVPATNNNSSTSTTKKDGKDSGLFGYELDSTKSHFFTSKDAWQRNFGFCKIYDDAAPLIAFYYDTERILFHYGEYDWMVQLWKGQYGFIFIGSEIGVYHKKDREVEFYDCATDENCLKMKMALYRDEDTLLFDRPEGYYWWTTGFVPGKLDRFADRSELKVVAKITLFDAEMRDAFLEGFRAAGFVEESEWVEPDVETNKSYARKKFYTVSGNTVSFTWQ